METDNSEGNVKDSSGKEIPTISVTEASEHLESNEKRDAKTLSHLSFQGIDRTGEPMDVEGTSMRDNDSKSKTSNRGSVYENVSYIETIPEEGEPYENDTFNLTKDSSLFSQVSQNKIIDGQSIVPKSNNDCKMVEIKEKVISRGISFTKSVEAMERTVLTPGSVELVEILDSGPESDVEKSPATIRRVPDQKNRKQLVQEEVVAKKQKLGTSQSETDEFPSNRGIDDRSEKSPLRVEISDQLNCRESATIAVPEDSTRTDKLITVQKQVQVNKTYQIVGNFSYPGPSKQEDNDSFDGSDKETEEALIFSEDEVRIEDDSTSNEELHVSNKKV